METERERRKGWRWMEWIDLIKLRRRHRTTTTATMDGECGRATKGKLKEPSSRNFNISESSFSLTLNTLVSLFAPSPLPSFPPAHSFRDLTWRTISYPVVAPLLFPTEDRPIGGKRDAKILDLFGSTGRNVSMTDSQRSGLIWRNWE